MNQRVADFGPVWGASGVQGFFGEGYWFHRWVPGLSFDGCTFVAKTTTLLDCAVSSVESIPVFSKSRTCCDLARSRSLNKRWVMCINQIIGRVDRCSPLTISVNTPLVHPNLSAARTITSVVHLCKVNLGLRIPSLCLGLQ